MNQNIEFLKEVLSIPTKTYNEELMIEFLVEWLEKKGIEYHVDDMGNVYATKKSGEVPADFYYPCVLSHTDTVHSINEIIVREEQKPNAQGFRKLALKGYTTSGKPTGIGGDDKCGVFACLTLLDELPFLKAAFFVSEETGCWGSREASPEFFSDVAYAIQLDAPSNYMVTEVCSGIRLWERDSEFFQICDGVFEEFMPTRQYMIHPYTDVSQLKKKFDFSCINFSCGYYSYHTPYEYVVVEDLQNSIKTAHEMINRLGYKKHFYEHKGNNRNLPWDSE